MGNLTDAFNQGPGNVTVAQLFGNFSQMTVTSGITGNVSLATSSSYQVMGRPMIGSLEYYEVNFTTSTSLFNESQVVMFAPNGTATSVSSPVLGNFTGASAQTMGEGDVSTFLIQLHSSAYVKGIQSEPGVAALNSTTVSLGPTQVNMTYYTLKSLPPTLPILAAGDPDSAYPVEFHDHPCHRFPGEFPPRLIRSGNGVPDPRRGDVANPGKATHHNLPPRTLRHLASLGR